MISPTVGKPLWYWPTRAGAIDNYDLANQPLAAFITYVNRDQTVNIAYLDRNGSPDRRITVPLWQRGQPRPMGNFCEFHPDDMTPGPQTVAKVASLSAVHTPEEIAKIAENPSRPVLKLKKSPESPA